MTRALLVDLGKVLVGFDHQVTCDRIAEATGASAGGLRPVLFGDLEASFDRGHLSSQEFFRACEEKAELPRLPKAIWIDAWRDIFQPLPNAIAALARVRTDVRRVLVSNTNALHWEGVLRVFDPSDRFDALVLSFRVGAVKPERAFWDAALAAAECAPGECLYADDRPELVAAAAARGIPGFVVHDAASFAAGLFEHGLLEEPHGPSGNSPTPRTVRLT
ncbi:MAG TPA: HAD family hydrolase [Thermoanaerobaculia bacterium]|nr:HAD family hydrolase [Thermoanaerobaculia bacterium]